MTKHLAYFLIVFALIFLQACDGNKTRRGEGAGRFGMMDDNTPEYAAVKFFEHLYHDKKLDKVYTYSTERLAKLMKSYHTNRNVQRHVLNLSYDKVEIKPDTGNSVGLNEFAEDAVITVFFTGYDKGEKKEDIRVVDMVRLNGKWKVEKIRADKFL